MAAYNIPAGKWVTIGWGVLWPKRLYWKVQTDETCSWMRISGTPWGGTFTRERSALIFPLWAVIRIKSPVTTLAVSSFNKAEVDAYQF